MANLNVAVIGPSDYARALGKKGTVSDIALYDFKKDRTTLTFIEPIKYPERLAPLFYAVSMSHTAILVVEAITPQLGECMVMLDCMGIRSGYFVLKNYLVPDQIAPLTKGTLLEDYKFLPDDPSFIKQTLLDLLCSRGEAGICERGGVAIDHFFNVKGVGTVALGCVVSGTIRKHDSLKIIPGQKAAQVRSIQKHDDDFDRADEGDRVGLALKGAEVEDLDRGSVLTNREDILPVNDLHARLRPVRYWKSPLKEGMVVHLGHWMQFLPARISSMESQGDCYTLGLSLEKPLALPPDFTSILCYLEGGKLRIIGNLMPE